MKSIRPPMIHYLAFCLFSLFIFIGEPSLSFAQLWPHMKTFGYDYGYPRDASELKWLATHHDAVVGAGDWQSKKISEFQYDTMKEANADVLIYPYVVITAYTFQDMEDFMREWASSHGYNSEDLYLHYYLDDVAKTASTCVQKDVDGKCSDETGKILAVGQSSRYYKIRGYGGGTAGSLQEARAYQYWNSGFRPRMNHLSEAWQEGYKAYVANIITVNASKNKYCDGVFVDTYPGPVSVEGYVPNIHHTIECRKAGYSTDDQSAREYYAEQLARSMNDLKIYLEQIAGKPITIMPNFAELSYTYNLYKFAIEEQFSPNKLDAGSIEYLTSPSKTTYWTARNYFKKFYDSHSMIKFFNNSDTAWYHYGKVPPLGGKQFMIASFYLLNNPNSYFGIHYGTAGNYGPKPTYAISHWDKMLEYDIGKPVTRSEADFWGETNTDRMYVIEELRPQRYVLAREYSKALVMVRFERSNNNTANDIGSDPREYELGGKYRRLLEDNSLGPIIDHISLGKSEGAILIKASAASEISPPKNLRISN